MPVEYLRVRNFKLIEDASMKFSRINLLIGPNASGKSTILHAINAVKTSTALLKNSQLSLGGREVYDYKDLVYLHDPRRWIQLEVKGFITLIKDLNLHYELSVKVSSDKSERTHLKLYVDETVLSEYDFEGSLSGSVNNWLEKGDLFVGVVGERVEPWIEVRSSSEGKALLYHGKFDDLLDESFLFCPALRGEIKL